jgi:hypothetical protein
MWDNFEKKKFLSSAGTSAGFLSLFLLTIFRFDDFVGIACEGTQKIGGRGIRVDAYPMFGRLVVRIADTIVLRLQILNTFRLGQCTL